LTWFFSKRERKRGCSDKDYHAKKGDEGASIPSRKGKEGGGTPVIGVRPRLFLVSCEGEGEGASRGRELRKGRKGEGRGMSRRRNREFHPFGSPEEKERNGYFLNDHLVTEKKKERKGGNGWSRVGRRQEEAVLTADG